MEIEKGSLFFLTSATLVAIPCHLSFQEEAGEHRESFRDAAHMEGFLTEESVPCTLRCVDEWF